jgi:protein disulfide-isomerase A1
MRYSLPLCGLLASVALASDVHQLKKDDFKGFVEEHDLVLAECRFRAALRSFIPSIQS